MRPFVLVGSASPYRQVRYRQELMSYGFNVTVVPQGVDTLSELAARTPSVLIIEFPLLWGKPNADGHSLEGDTEPADWKNIPVVLLANDGATDDPCRLSRFPICGFFERFPSGSELVSAIRNALHSIQPEFIPDRSQNEAVCRG